jgi:hypothetical protein
MVAQFPVLPVDLMLKSSEARPATKDLPRPYSQEMRPVSRLIAPRTELLE